jgi:hypothetical protein
MMEAARRRRDVRWSKKGPLDIPPQPPFAHPEGAMPEDFVTLTTFADPGEAEIVCARLRDEGVAAFVSGDIATGVFPGLGATSQVQLQVPQADLERAQEVLAASRKRAAANAEERSLFWSCPKCGRHADYETELCPSCGALLDPPYDPDLSPEQEEDEEEQQAAGRPTPADTWVGDKLATRAFRAAIVGFFLWWPWPPVPVAALPAGPVFGGTERLGLQKMPGRLRRRCLPPAGVVHHLAGDVRAHVHARLSQGPVAAVVALTGPAPPRRRRARRSAAA